MTHSDLATRAVATAGIVPARPTAIICNFAVTNTTGGGYLTVNPGGNNIVAASTISWFGSGQVLANGVAVPVSNDLKVTVTVIAGGGGQTDFVLDVTG